MSKSPLRSLLHELRNAQGALRLSLDFLERHDCSHAQYQDAIADAVRAHARIAQHVEQLGRQLEQAGVLKSDGAPEQHD